MNIDKFEYSLGQWKNLADLDRIKVINHYWDPYNTKIGHSTKREIVDDFIRQFKIPARQFGIKSFGWTVYMLYVVVDNSGLKVPTKFLGLPVNKGIVLRPTNDHKTIVKFRYGGTAILDLTKTIIIG